MNERCCVPAELHLQRRVVDWTPSPEHPPFGLLCPHPMERIVWSPAVHTKWWTYSQTLPFSLPMLFSPLHPHPQLGLQPSWPLTTAKSTAEKYEWIQQDCLSLARPTGGNTHIPPTPPLADQSCIHPIQPHSFCPKHMGEILRIKSMTLFYLFLPFGPFSESCCPANSSPLFILTALFVFSLPERLN